MGILETTEYNLVYKKFEINKVTIFAILGFLKDGYKKSKDIKDLKEYIIKDKKQLLDKLTDNHGSVSEAINNGYICTYFVSNYEHGFRIPDNSTSLLNSMTHIDILNNKNEIYIISTKNKKEFYEKISRVNHNVDYTINRSISSCFYFKNEQPDLLGLDQEIRIVNNGYEEHFKNDTLPYNIINNNKNKNKNEK